MTADQRETPRICTKCGAIFPDCCTCTIPTFEERKSKTCPNCGAFGVIDGLLERDISRLRGLLVEVVPEMEWRIDYMTTYKGRAKDADIARVESLLARMREAIK